MSTGLAHDFKEQVRSRTDLVALVSESITLQPRRGGREFVGLCPFHDDHNPSLTVSPERQSYKCWSCGEGGDCFSWVMKHDALSFPEALRLLAERAGLEVPRSYRRGDNTPSDLRRQLHEVLNWAEGEFHHFLQTARAAEAARQYLSGRGFSEETLQRYRIGFHPPDWTWILKRARNRFSVKLLRAAGLVGERHDREDYYDFFVDRVLFPIHDERGRTVAFGGRILPGNTRDDRKYWNSPESLIFSKSRLLYGLNTAREAIRRKEEVLVTEGYTDCILLSQHGVENVVATLGTALTEQHVQLLRRFCRKVVLVFDGDMAGRLASERSLGKFLAHEIDLRILLLPAGEDPADFVSRQGADTFRQLVQTAPEAGEFKLQSAIATHTLNSLDSRHRVLGEMLDFLAGAPRLAGTVREDLLLSRLSRQLQIPEQSIRRELQKVRRSSAARSRPPATTGPASVAETSISPVIPGSRAPLSSLTETPQAHHPASAEKESAAKENVSAERLSPAEVRLEEELLEIILAQPALMSRVAEEVSPADISDVRLQQIFRLCRELWEQQLEPTYDRLMTALEDADLKRLVTELEELSRRKKVAEKLQPVAGGKGLPPPTLYEEVVRRLEWRRQRKRQTPEDLSSTPAEGLTPHARHQLRELTELRRIEPHHRLKPPSGRKH